MLPARLTPRLALAAGALLCVPAPRAAAQRDPAEPAAVREARSAQRTFEFTRRMRLPPPDARSDAPRYYYGGVCPVRIGRMCWFDDGDNSAPPPEPAGIRAARDRLLEQLARAAAADSVNEWVAGQRVRYLLEARRPDSALAVTRACSAVGASTVTLWCLGLRGTVLHATHQAAAAAAAFDSADALRTPAERCQWYDVSPWLESGEARAYRRLACGSPERARWESRFWRLAQPFWILDGNDLRNEWNARRVMGRVYAAGANAYGMSWGPDLAELDLRYGPPIGYSRRRDGAALSMYAPDAGADVTGHEPGPSYDWLPRERTLLPERVGVADVPDGAWQLHRSVDEAPQMRYAPGYAGGGVGAPTHQLARFRHGDTALVVGAYDAARDSLWSDGRTPPRISAALFVVDDSGRAAGVARRDSAGRAGTLVARVPAVGAGDPSLGRRYLYGLEILQHDSVHTPDGRHVLGRALRARAPMPPLAADAELSDLLVLRRSPGPTPKFGEAVDSAAGSVAVRRGGAMGVYWEQYGAAPGGAVAPDTIVIAATRLTRSFRERVAGALHLGGTGPDRPIALRFADPGGAGPGRAIGLTWPDATAGDYRLEVTRIPGTPGRRPATSALVVHLTDE